MFEKDSLMLGLIAGIIIPVAAFALLLTFKDGLVSGGVIPVEYGDSLSLQRTLAVLAICANVISLQIFNKRKFYQTVRGIVFPTFAYVGFWMYHYGGQLLGF